MESKIVCRKCNGPHLTIKCGKEKENKIEKLIVTENKEENTEDKPKFFRKERTDDNRDNRDNRDNKYNRDNRDNRDRDNRDRDNSDYKKRKFHKVKLNYLPVNITEEEILESLYEECGLKVSKIKVNNYHECSNAYIEFRTEEEVKYIVDALHKTPFEHQIIHVEQIFD
jgi:hypothetical protein